MERSQLSSVLLLLFVVVAFSIAAPSVEQPTRGHGGQIFSGRGISADVINATQPMQGDQRVESSGNSSSQLNGSETQTENGSKTGTEDGFGGLPLLEIIAGVVMSALIVGSVFAVYRISGTRIDPDRFVDSEEPPESTDGQSNPDLTALGTAAGRAAERIEHDDTQNAVYRTWREMTTLLDLSDPEVTTPGEFADEATSAGMNREDVARLTTLFEEVRYGDAPVTADRRQQAREALQRIESRYGDEP